MLLTPICEFSDSVFSDTASKLSDLQEQNLADPHFSSKYRKDLSETFVALNRAFPSSTAECSRISKGSKSTGADRLIPMRVLDRSSPTQPQKSLQKYLSSVALDVLPCLIAAIWAAAILLSIPTAKLA